MTIEPFTVDIGEPIVADLQRRLRDTRWPDQLDGAGWEYGAERSWLQDICGYWADGFDWAVHQDRLNTFDHAVADIDEDRVHFVRVPGAGARPVPLLLLHGWPSSFVQMLRIAPMLADPAAHGAPDAISFDVVIPSLPGYGFSSRPTRPGASVRTMAETFHTLMTAELGHDRYATRGTDLGAGILQQLALAHPEALLGVHQGGTNPYVAYVPDDLSEAEHDFVVAAQHWTNTEMAYAQMHSSKPQTVAYGLNDSPAGLAAWVLEKFRRWSDGDPEEVFGRDELLTNLTIYWATETIGSSMRLYFETARDGAANWGRVEVRTAMAMTRDMFPTPRSWVERNYAVERWTDLPRGGHFPEWDVPELIAADLQAFYGER